ncbi:MAG: class I SAM-dependent methyltransferase [Fusobacteria bacterium]|nr:class I SAM-dependent methyltransferase [Fusobacteriota bacterium]
MNKLFNLIAGVYGWFFDYQIKIYQKSWSEIENNIDFTGKKRVLDIGCGTGALASVLSEAGFIVTGIDPAKKMIKVATRKTKNQDIKLLEGSIFEESLFDETFDFCIASYVAHGLKKDERLRFYKRCRDLAKDLVLFIDYNSKKNLGVSMIEFLEGGNYFDFIKDPVGDLKEVFDRVEVIDLNGRGACYVCISK